MICAENLSSKSNYNSKVSTTGSAGSDHALKDEYFIANSDNATHEEFTQS